MKKDYCFTIFNAHELSTNKAACKRCRLGGLDVR